MGCGHVMVYWLTAAHAYYARICDILCARILDHERDYKKEQLQFESESQA